jgi:hypothetical protein
MPRYGSSSRSPTLNKFLLLEFPRQGKRLPSFFGKQYHRRETRGQRTYQEQYTPARQHPRSRFYRHFYFHYRSYSHCRSYSDYRSYFHCIIRYITLLTFITAFIISHNCHKELGSSLRGCSFALPLLGVPQEYLRKSRDLYTLAPQISLPRPEAQGMHIVAGLSHGPFR